MSWIAHPPLPNLCIEVLLPVPENQVYSDPGWLVNMRSYLSRVGPSPNMTVDLMKRIPCEEKETMHTKGRRWRETQGEGSHGQAKASEGTSPAHALILDSQPPELWDNIFLLFKPPHPCYFVMAAPRQQIYAPCKFFMLHKKKKIFKFKTENKYNKKICLSHSDLGSISII